MVPNPIEGLDAQVEGCQRHVGSPYGVIESTFDEGIESVFAGVATWPMSAIVTERDRFAERDVEAEGPRDAGGHLGHLQGVCEPRALVIAWEDEDLGLA